MSLTHASVSASEFYETRAPGSGCERVARLARRRGIGKRRCCPPRKETTRHSSQICRRRRALPLGGLEGARPGRGRPPAGRAGGRRRNGGAGRGSGAPPNLSVFLLVRSFELRAAGGARFRCLSVASNGWHCGRQPAQVACADRLAMSSRSVGHASSVASADPARGSSVARSWRSHEPQIPWVVPRGDLWVSPNSLPHQAQTLRMPSLHSPNQRTAVQRARVWASRALARFPPLPPKPQAPPTSDWPTMLDPFSTFSQLFLNRSLFVFGRGVR
jgi:hypothetical protein